MHAIGALALQVRKSMAASLFVVAAAVLPADCTCLCNISPLHQQQQQRGDDGKCSRCIAERRQREDALSDAALRLLNDDADCVKVSA